MTNIAVSDPQAALDEATRLTGQGLFKEAIACLEPYTRTSTAVAVEMGYLLVRADQAPLAVKLLEVWVGRPDADFALLTAYAFALKSAEMIEEALAQYRLAVDRFPTEGMAEHNLAAALGDANYFAEAERATSRALGKGFDNPETWLVRARALAGIDRDADAERVYRQAITRAPNHAQAHSELAQAIWMATGDADLATGELDAARLRFPTDGGLALAKAKFLEAIGRDQEAIDTLEAALTAGASPLLAADAVVYCTKRDPARAMQHALSALAIAPGDAGVLTAYCQAQLAVGDATGALATADRLSGMMPRDQFPICLRGTALRLLGDDRYRELYDYETLVKHRPIETPEGWSSLDAYLVDLAAGLEGLHHHQAHPIGQSLRNGAQTPRNLKRSENPAIQAFFPALEQSIADYIAGAGNALGWSGEPRVNGAWSVRLKPNGFHINHLHPRGVISSAFHVTVPDTVEQGHEGWLAFGQPGVPTRPALEAEHFIKPRPGWLALFPSYMWHGTVPFSGDGVRLTMAFDVIAT
jgi:tetratricopeptide (TPR) repeat protein